MDEQRLTQEQVLSLVHKLLSRTVERGATEAEAATCTTKAQELLLEYNLSACDLQEPTSERSGWLQVAEQSVKCSPHRNRGNKTWYATIAREVARGCSCRVFLNNYKFGLVFIGTELDVKVAVELYQYIVEQVEQLCYKTCYNIPDVYALSDEQVRFVQINGVSVKTPKNWNISEHRPQGNAVKFYNSFFLGCSLRVASRLRTRYSEVVIRHATEGSQALVLLREEQINSYVKATMKVQQTTLRCNKGDENVVQLGYMVGANVNLANHARLEG